MTKKKCRVNNKQTKCSNILIFHTKYEFYLPPDQLPPIVLAFGQAKGFFKYHILMKILSMNYFIFFGLATKIAYHHSTQNVITELQTTFQNQKRTCFTEICLFNGLMRFCHMFYTGRI